MKKNRTSWLMMCLFLGFSCLLNFANAQSQNGVVRCYTDEQHAIRLANNPELEQKEAFEQWINAEIAYQNQNTNRIIGGVYQIPVVVHVIHNGEAVGSGTNISQAAIQSQIDVLNEDFRRIFGSNGYNTDPVGADTQIEFCLAQRRPDGSAFAAGQPGVNRINRTTAGFTAPPYSTTYIDATIKPYTYNGNVPTATRGWDPAKYMNFWVCNISGGVLGYAQFPQTPLGGMGCGAQGVATDGVVMLYNSIGKSSVTGFGGVYNEGRTATHEIGHWLGLRHIWGDGGCTVDDFCNDTPEAGAANFGCPTGTNSCTANPGNDMINNYMDYTDDLCMDIFTNDQKARMRTVLENSPLRVSLINSNACIPPNPNDASVVDIINPKGDNCAGSLIPTVVIKNRGSANLTACTINYKIDNGTATTFSYTGNLAPGATANVALTAFTSYLGTHSFKAYTTLPNGVADPSTLYDTTEISFVVSNGIMAPFTENFDGSVFPPDVRWVVENANNDCFEWVSASAVSSAGVFNNNAAQMPSFGNTTGGTENLVTPIFILPCNASVANIQFDVAYRRRNNTAANYERLYIEISQDCGATWTTAPIYDKTGTILQVLTTTATAYYQPVGTTDWRTETVDLLPFVTSTSKNVKFRFRAVAANGNNIYVDNFRFNATTPGEIKVTQGTPEVLDGGAYNFGTATTCTTTSRTFTITNTGTTNLVLTNPISITGSAFTVGTTFGSTTIAAGGTTTFSVNFNPQVAGSFSETISFATNDCDEGTYDFLLLATATGSPCAVASYSSSTSSICVGQTVTFTNSSTNATTYSWNFGSGASPATANTAGPHTVTYSTAGTPSIVLTVDGGSTSNQSITVNALPATPTISASGSTTFCQGGSVTLTSSPQNAYAWSNGASTAATTITTSGSYSVIVTNTAGCSATSTPTTVTVNALPATPTVSSSGSTALCSGNSVTLTSSSASNNTWSTGATTQSITVSSAGSYFVTVSNSAGCTATSASTDVTIGTPPTTPTISTSGSTTFCPGGSVTLTSSADNSYLWSNGATSQSITIGAAGTYSVTVSNAAGCSSAPSSGTTVTLLASPSTPTISAGGSTTFCSGGSVVLSSSSENSYLWSNGATTPSITVSSSGSFSVTVTNTSGCSATSSTTNVTVANPPSTPTISAGGNTTFCQGGSVVLTSSSENGYAWSNGATTQSITVNSSGSYSVVVSNSAGCTSATSSSTTVTVNPLPTVALSSQPSVCTYTAPFTLTGGTPSGGTYSGNGVSSGTFNPSVVGAGTSIITYSFTNANGCSNTSQSGLVVDACLSLNENSEFVWSVYPNPANGIVQIDFSAGVEKIKIYDQLGKLVREIKLVENETNSSFDSSEFASGCYRIVLESNQFVVQKIVVIQ